MEVITKDEVRLNRNDQARRIEGYRFKLWMMERKKRHDGRTQSTQTRTKSLLSTIITRMSIYSTQISSLLE